MDWPSFSRSSIIDVFGSLRIISGLAFSIFLSLIRTCWVLLKEAKAKRNMNSVSTSDVLWTQQTRLAACIFFILFSFPLNNLVSLLILQKTYGHRKQEQVGHGHVWKRKLEVRAPSKNSSKKSSNLQASWNRYIELRVFLFSDQLLRLM